jgi:hypothetical protein
MVFSDLHLELGKGLKSAMSVEPDKFSADTDQSPQDPPGSGTKQDRIYRFP